jgi:release factor glutamine methyltransferase
MNIRELLARTASGLERAGVEEPRLQAELLLADLLGCDRGGLVVRAREQLQPVIEERYLKRIARRELREPLQHIIGTQEFYGLELRIDGRALIPRPESEGLIEAALSFVPPRGGSAADLGTGSGCLAVALAVARPDLRLYAIDRSADALDVARDNARRHGVDRRISFVEGDMGSPPAAWRGIMDLVVSNPPYVSEAEWLELEPEVRDHDPRHALVAGPTGLEAYGLLLPAASELLRPGGLLALELGLGQAEAVGAMVRDEGLRLLEVRPDFQGIPRVLLAAA